MPSSDAESEPLPRSSRARAISPHSYYLYLNRTDHFAHSSDVVGILYVRGIESLCPISIFASINFLQDLCLLYRVKHRSSRPESSYASSTYSLRLRCSHTTSWCIMGWNHLSHVWFIIARTRRPAASCFHGSFESKLGHSIRTARTWKQHMEFQ